MKKVNNLTRRISMVVLFVFAIFTTFQTISGVEAQTFMTTTYIGVDGERGEDNSSGTHKFKTLGLAFKMIKKIAKFETQISSSEAVAGEAPKLEEAIDWSKYPSRTVVATGYTAGYESTGKTPDNPSYGITYSGVKVKRDLYSTIAADLNIYPVGTVLFIPGYGYGVVADKGGAIRGNEIDLFYETVDDVYDQWGKKTVEVYVVKMGDGDLSEQELVALNETESMQVFRQQYIATEKE